MKTAIKPTTTFRTELTKNILARIKAFKKDGTTGVGLACLLQNTRTPSVLDGAPLGTNAAYYYKIMFREIALGTPAISRFLITTDY